MTGSKRFQLKAKRKIPVHPSRSMPPTNMQVSKHENETASRLLNFRFAPFSDNTDTQPFHHIEDIPDFRDYETRLDEPDAVAPNPSDLFQRDGHVRANGEEANVIQCAISKYLTIPTFRRSAMLSIKKGGNASVPKTQFQTKNRIQLSISEEKNFKAGIKTNTTEHSENVLKADNCEHREEHANLKQKTMKELVETTQLIEHVNHASKPEIGISTHIDEWEDGLPTEQKYIGKFLRFCEFKMKTALRQFPQLKGTVEAFENMAGEEWLKYIHNQQSSAELCQKVSNSIRSCNILFDGFHATEAFIKMHDKLDYARRVQMEKRLSIRNHLISDSFKRNSFVGHKRRRALSLIKAKAINISEERKIRSLIEIAAGKRFEQVILGSIGVRNKFRNMYKDRSRLCTIIEIANENSRMDARKIISIEKKILEENNSVKTKNQDNCQMWANWSVQLKAKGGRKQTEEGHRNKVRKANTDVSKLEPLDVTEALRYSKIVPEKDIERSTSENKDFKSDPTPNYSIILQDVISFICEDKNAMSRTALEEAQVLKEVKECAALIKDLES